MKYWSRFGTLQGPQIVDDLDAVKYILLRHGGEVIMQEYTSPTGRAFWGRHPDGNRVEYVQWNPELIERLIMNAP